MRALAAALRQLAVRSGSAVAVARVQRRAVRFLSAEQFAASDILRSRRELKAAPLLFYSLLLPKILTLKSNHNAR